MTRKGNHRRPGADDAPGGAQVGSTGARTGGRSSSSSQAMFKGPFGMGNVTQDEARQAVEAGTQLAYAGLAFVSALPGVFLTKHQPSLLNPLFGAIPVASATQSLHRGFGGLAMLLWLAFPQVRAYGWRPFALVLGWSLAVGPALTSYGGEFLLPLGPLMGVYTGRFLLEGVTTLARYGWIFSVLGITEIEWTWMLPLNMVIPMLVPFTYRPWFNDIDERVLLPLHGAVLVALAFFAPRLPSPPPPAAPRPQPPVLPRKHRQLLVLLSVGFAVTALFPFAPLKMRAEGRVIDSARGLTGRIIVGEELVADKGWFRYLRADHSLLGGVWLGEKGVKSLDSAAEREVVQTGESIYSTFVLQEAVRLAAPANRPSDAPDERALVIGLGAGLSARSLAQHEVETTVVEIDPVVFDFARKYFAAPHPDVKVIQDARKFLKKKSSVKFDYIIHDVFTGGSLPASVFTNETFVELKNRLHPWGTLAINFAGDLSSPVAGSVLQTLTPNFPSCRAFSSDGPAKPVTEKVFQNVVIFCSADGRPVTFRKPSSADLLQGVKTHSNGQRTTILNEFQNWELPTGWQDEVARGGWILTDKAHSGFDTIQEKEVNKHWELMKEVLPNKAWADIY